MVLDEPKQSDHNVVIEEIMFLLSEETIKLIGEVVSLDYRQKFGYRLSNTEEVLSYRLQLKMDKN